MVITFFHCLQCSSFENITISSVLKTLRKHCAECRDFFRYFIYFFTNRLDLQSGAEMKKKKKIEDTTKIDMTLAKKVHREQYPENKSKNQGRVECNWDFCYFSFLVTWTNLKLYSKNNENVGSEPVSQYLSGLQLSYRAAQQTYIDEGCIQKRRQKSSLFLGGQNCVNSLPH